MYRIAYASAKRICGALHKSWTSRNAALLFGKIAIICAWLVVHIYAAIYTLKMQFAHIHAVKYMSTYMICACMRIHFCNLRADMWFTHTCAYISSVHVLTYAICNLRILTKYAIYAPIAWSAINRYSWWTSYFRDVIKTWWVNSQRLDPGPWLYVILWCNNTYISRMQVEPQR